jgi:trans-aconitate methyltransferase
MEKLGPGSNEQTLRALSLLPRRRFEMAVDAGCGTGRQTIALARELGAVIHAIDSHQPFLDHLEQVATAANVADLIRAQCMDMKDIPKAFRGIDLLWSEGAAYNIGFANALRTWAPAIGPDGFAVVSELSWLSSEPPVSAMEFFSAAYPGMQSVYDNVNVAEDAGYELLRTLTFPREAWLDGYYDVLAPRAKALLDHVDAQVREYAAETIREIDVFDRSNNSYGYVFYVLQRR